MVANQNTKAISIIEEVQNDPLVIEAQRRQNEVLAIQQTVFQLGVHYGPPYKGAKNNTLLKPGATFLQQKFQLREQHERIETTIHVDPTDLSKSYIIIQNRCRIFNVDGAEVAQADAACTTFEDKYVFRGGGDKTCPTCGEPKIIKSKFDKGFYCLACKAKFAEDDAAIINQDTTKKLNPNPLNLLDTIVAMAQKRASVRATIKATGVDAIFSPGDGVTVDYYDDLENTNEQLITVVQKNAPDSPLSNEKPPTNDFDEKQVSDSPASQNGVKSGKTPAERLGTPSGQRIGGFVYDRIKLFMEAAKVKALADVNSTERNNTIIAMESEGAFKDVTDYQQCVELVIARINSPEHGKGKKAKKTEEVVF